MQDAAESLLNMVNTLNETVYMSGSLIEWVSGKSMCNQFIFPSSFHIDWTHRYLSAPESDGDMVTNSTKHNETLTSTALLREWAKATLANGEWQDALVAAASVGVSISSGTPLRLTIAS